MENFTVRATDTGGLLLAISSEVADVSDALEDLLAGQVEYGTCMHPGSSDCSSQVASVKKELRDIRRIEEWVFVAVHEKGFNECDVRFAIVKLAMIVDAQLEELYEYVDACYFFLSNGTVVML